jgi:hypothetical protein
MLEMDKYAALLFLYSKFSTNVCIAYVLGNGLACCKNNSFGRLKITASSLRQEQEINLCNNSFPTYASTLFYLLIIQYYTKFQDAVLSGM